MNKAKKYIISFTKEVAQPFFATLVVAVLIMHSFYPQVVNATTGEQVTEVARATLPVAPDRAPRKVTTVVATAYNSLAWQTDNTPFVTASGTHTRHGVVAANFLPIGAHVRFPDVYGDTIFVVEDRMNKKYYRGRVDIWMEGLKDARVFGAKRLKMEVF